VPLWIGGRSDAALRRAARHDGWCAYASSLRRIRASVERIGELRGSLDDYRISYVVFTCVADRAQDAREQMARVLGRRYQQDFEQFLDSLCAVGTAEDVAGRIAAYREAGVDDILCVPQVPWQEIPEQVDRLAGALTL
jgi:alkanesulfonate monooxygenase SsuD/methylene tetrahydromethanopterin reductase-like flavin-dependent oxidoreductase (luciferase family)